MMKTYDSRNLEDHIEYVRKSHDANFSIQDIPVIPHIDAMILQAIRQTESEDSLNMSDWHICDTEHCRAGWAIHLAGQAGYALEDKLGSPVAATLIYLASRPGQRIPDFYCGNTEAMEDIERCAAADPLPT